MKIYNVTIYINKVGYLASIQDIMVDVYKTAFDNLKVDYKIYDFEHSKSIVAFMTAYQYQQFYFIFRNSNIVSECNGIIQHF